MTDPQLLVEKCQQRDAVPTPARRGFRLNAAATYLGVSLQTVAGLIRTGQLPSVRVGGMVLVTVEALDRILREGASTPQPKQAEYNNRRRQGRPRLDEVKQD